MGIDRAQLYGVPRGDGSAGSSLAVTDGRAAQTFRVDVPRGTSPIAPIGLPFAALTVLADNPSTYWYRVNGRWIPPWTVGAVIPLPEPSAQLTIVTAEPEGYLIDTIGADLVLVASSADLDPSPGLFVPRSAPFLLAAREDGIDSVPGGVYVVGWIPAAPAGSRNVLVDLQVAAVNGFSGNLLRGMVQVTLVANLVPTFPVLAKVAITPAAPATLERVTRQPGTGEAIDLRIEAENGISAVVLELVATYYVQSVTP